MTRRIRVRYTFRTPEKFNVTGVDPATAELLRRKQPILWINNHWLPMQQTRGLIALGLPDLRKAGESLDRFAGLLRRLFPELQSTGGIIESALRPAEALRQMLFANIPGRWLIKCDHELPVAGSVKARGGIYEVLVHAEDLLVRAGLMDADADRTLMASPQARAYFARHQILVGSTGNLGLSIGVMAATLGFRAIVHMSADAKAWKKARLRSHGVEVVEHAGDYEAAVRAGRVEASGNPLAYFVDDENSSRLFLGYGVAALRLRQQFIDQRVRVDATHPLFVYLPCGVGGAPGGITFGLRQVFGDHVHCFFAEPTASPCMLVRLAAQRDAVISVADVGLDNRTEADGLAVGRASEFVARLMRPLVSGIFTVADGDLYTGLHAMKHSEGLHLEPSAVAGLCGPQWLLNSSVGCGYLAAHGLSDCVREATHIIWTTGGALLPEEEFRLFEKRGRLSLVQQGGRLSHPLASFDAQGSTR